MFVMLKVKNGLLKDILILFENLNTQKYAMFSFVWNGLPSAGHCAE